LPPFSPEVNPAEKIWVKFKRPFTNKIYKTLNQVSDFIKQQAQNLKKEETKNICAFDYIFVNPF
jgi:transposase